MEIAWHIWASKLRLLKVWRACEEEQVDVEELDELNVTVWNTAFKTTHTLQHCNEPNRQAHLRERTITNLQSLRPASTAASQPSIWTMKH